MKILIPLPSSGFDPTETAIPWQVFSEAGIEVAFATPSAEKATTDYRMLTVEDEVTSALSDNDNFLVGPKPLFRDSPDHLDRGYVVKDKHYLSARWPGDAYSISLEMVKLLEAA